VANFDGTVTILRGNGKGGFTKTATAYPAGNGPQSLASADFNGDGLRDLAVANSADDTVSILRGKGDGTFRAKVDFGTGHTPYSVAAGDFNRDGRPDLVTADYGAGTASVLLNTTKNGVLKFAAAVPVASGKHTWSVAVGDINSDGRPDLVVADSGDNAAIVVPNVGGTQLFGAAVTVPTGLMPTSIAVGDLNRDGKPDLATSDWGATANAASVMLNTLVMKPTIGSLKPTSGRAGATLTITGKGFWGRRGASKVYIGSKAVTRYLSWSATTIKVRVPAIGAGRRVVKVKTSGGTSNTKYFRVQ
jgi:hypothetical protein